MPPRMRPRTDQLRQAMQAAGYNTVRLAKRIGLSKQYVAMLAKGVRGCKPSTAEAVAEVLGVDVDTLFVTTLSENSYNEMEDDVAAITEEDPYLLFDEVCRLTRTPPGTMRNLRTAGKGPRFFKRGRRLMCRQSEALAWMQAHEQNAE